MPEVRSSKTTFIAIAIAAASMYLSVGSSSQFSAGATAGALQPAMTGTAAMPDPGTRHAILVSSVSTAADTESVSSVSAASPPEPAGTTLTTRMQPGSEPYRLFPSLLRPAPASNRTYGPVHLTAAEPAVEESRDRLPLLAGNQVLAFYGKPGARSMGILGEYSKEKLAPLLEGYAQLYDAANGTLGVVPAFYIIYGTCWPEGEIGILNRRVVEEYIEFAAERGWIVFLDHQIGKYSVADSVRTMLPFLQYPNVHLAIDPEWRTLKPMREIGSITAAELNEAQQMVDSYLRDNALPGIRMLVVHQFKAQMIRDAMTVRADRDRVVLVHTADGFGSPALKKNTYAYNARLSNMPVKGFKLFFRTTVAGAGWDDPLMKPEDVLALDPMPLVIMYQ